jgi:hypothetical protein
VSGAARGTHGWTGRFPGFDALDQVRHWDQVTAEVVLARTGPPAAVKFFTEPEESCARALLNLLTGQDQRGGVPSVPVLEMVDSRLAAGETDGWRYADMPEDGQAWRDTLAFLDGDAYERCGAPLADAPEADQKALVQAVQDLKSADWHRLPAAHVWSLWTRYACTAFYAHPFAWTEIGFPGPAYPRGYKNTGVGKLEPFEVRDAQPAEDPVREAGLWMASGRGTSRRGCCPTTAPGPTTACGGTCAGSPMRTRSTW